MQMLKSLSLFSHTCMLCHAPCQQRDCCLDCTKDLPWYQDQNTPLLRIQANIIAAFSYQAPISDLITKLKFHQDLTAGKVLSDSAGDVFSKHYAGVKKPELIIPVPLHRKRLQMRGYNQALELAKPISNHLSIPISLYDCIRQKNTKAQTDIKAKDRKKNLHNAFKVVNNISAKHIAIVDDVITTGSTIVSFYKTLQNHGIKQIDIWCIARALN